MRSAWIVTGLAVLGVIMAGAESRAGTAGISIHPGGIRPGKGDPPWDFVFDVYLDPGFEVLAGGSTNPIYDYFDVQGLTGVDSNSLTHQPTSIPNIIWTPTPASDSATWTFTGLQSTPNTGPGELYLGQFIVETDGSFSTPPVTPGTLMHYNFQIYDISLGKTIDGSGTFTLVLLGVPEPSSVVMLAVGAGAVATIAVRRKSRRPGAAA